MGLWYDLLIQYWCYFYSFAASVLFPFKLFDATTDELIGKYDNLLIGQKYDWDCGLACCAMAIRWSGRGDDCSAELYSNQELTQRPLWTIDLLIYLLNQNVAAEMYTIYTGVNPDHDNNIWYNQHGLAAEAESINQKFQLAKAQNLRIHEVRMYSYQYLWPIVNAS